MKGQVEMGDLDAAGVELQATQVLAENGIAGVGC
jgi:hypothetical protein